MNRKALLHRELAGKTWPERNVWRHYQNVSAKGYTRQVVKDTSTEGKWYPPHFAIHWPGKTPTKTRIVFDASAGADDVCLNNYIHRGPKLQCDLIYVLLRFRRFPVAVTCDVSEVYLQIELQPEDRPYHRFLWRDMEEREADEYEFSRLVFGVNSCPFQAFKLSS